MMLVQNCSIMNPCSSNLLQLVTYKATLVSSASIKRVRSSGCAGHAAPVMMCPSEKHLAMGSGSCHTPPASWTTGFTAGYAVHFFP